MIHRAAAGPDVAGRRLDDALKGLFPHYSKTRIRGAIEWGGVRIGGAVVRVASRPLREGDEVSLGIPGTDDLRDFVLAPEDILLDDGEYLAVAKPPGIYCQRTPYQLKGTVEFAVSAYFRSRGSREPARVIHRLDAGTSGVMVFPVGPSPTAHLAKKLEAGEVEKVYWAVVSGTPAARDWIADAPVGRVGKSRFGVTDAGRAARTAFRVLASAGGETLREARPLTGRTHQIRVHLAAAGLPVAGDDRYGGPPAPRLMLHCRRMAFRARDGRPVDAAAPPDAAFREAMASAGADPDALLRPTA